MAALTTNQNRPKVTMVRGNVMTLRNRPRVALMKPMTSAAIKAAAGPRTATPGTTWATTHTATALRIQCTSSLIPLLAGDYMRLDLQSQLKVRGYHHPAVANM